MREQEAVCYHDRMRTLGLDVGERRIGVAVSDPEGRMAVPMETVERRGAGDARAILAIARREDAGRIVVGLPISMDGSHGKQADTVSSFADALRVADGPQIVLWDERLSSAEADRYLRESSKKARQEKGLRDRIAASIILQAYLDHQRHPPPPLPPIE